MTTAGARYEQKLGMLYERMSLAAEHLHGPGFPSSAGQTHKLFA
jgi:hypothetical protein